jgi:hypothetical protein
MRADSGEVNGKDWRCEYVFKGAKVLRGPYKEGVVGKYVCK